MIASLHLSAQQEKQKPEVNTKQKTPVKIIEMIVGTWKVNEIYRGNKEATGNDTTELNQVMEFNREGRYVTHNGTVKIDSGAYRLSEQHGILYLESEWQGKSPSEWNVSFKQNTMTLQQRGEEPQARRLRYIYLRKGIAKRASNN
jgi:hypothetical protein